MTSLRQALYKTSAHFIFIKHFQNIKLWDSPQKYVSRGYHGSEEDVDAGGPKY